MTSLQERVVAEIDAAGPLSFSRFMQLALYDPTDGFYAAGGAGRRGDFITSPEVGPLFGRLVARALDRWWDDLGQPDPFSFVEVGAGPGTLARSVLRAGPRCREALRYLTVEVSEAQRARHPVGVEALARLPIDLGVAVVFANELFDNLPFDLFDHAPDVGWREVRVGRNSAGTLSEELIPVGEHVMLPAVDADRHCRVPLQRAAAEFVADVRGRLDRGYLVVVDYRVDSFPAPEGRDWLRTYRGHERGGSPLDSPGSQDITADVDLAALAAVAPPTRVSRQREWLEELGLDELVEEGRRYWEAHAAAPDLRAIEARSRISEAAALTDEAGLGGFAVVEWRIG